MSDIGYESAALAETTTAPGVVVERAAAEANR